MGHDVRTKTIKENCHVNELTIIKVAQGLEFVIIKEIDMFCFCSFAKHHDKKLKW